MMAKLRYLRMSPRKVRLVSDLVRGMDVEHAKRQLQFSPRRAAPAVHKLLNTAIANAKHNFSKSEESLYIKKIVVDQGPTYKRFRPTGRGFVSPLKKRTSHVTIILDERVEEKTVEKPKKKEKAKTNSADK